jgi:hypothetical protein
MESKAASATAAFLVSREAIGESEGCGSAVSPTLVPGRVTRTAGRGCQLLSSGRPASDHTVTRLDLNPRRVNELRL